MCLLPWQTAVFEAADQFARIEGSLPAPESSHAIRVPAKSPLPLENSVKIFL